MTSRRRILPLQTYRDMYMMPALQTQLLLGHSKRTFEIGTSIEESHERNTKPFWAGGIPAGKWTPSLY